MQVLGIGPLELVFILIIALLVLGPRGMVNTARQGGELIRKLVRSPLWKEVVDTSREIREIPGKLVREAGVEKELDMLRRAAAGDLLVEEEQTDIKKPESEVPPGTISDVLPDKTDKNR